MITAVFLLITSCLGVQTGGEEGPRCSSRVETLPELTTIPHGFSRRPIEALASVPQRISGILRLSDGAEVPITIEFVIEEQSARAVYYDPIVSGAVCGGPYLVVTGTLLVDGGEIISGEMRVGVTIHENGSITVQADGNQLNNVPSPHFENEPLESPALSAAFLVGTDGQWRGDFVWHARISCERKQLCSGYESAPLGTFSSSE